MRYEYLITDNNKNTETIKAMSYKKLIKQLNNKFNEGQVISVKYQNKKGHDLLKYVKIKRVE